MMLRDDAQHRSPVSVPAALSSHERQMKAMKPRGQR